MAGAPWEKYQSAEPAASDAAPDGPWKKYQPANDAGPAPDDDSDEAEPKPPEVDQKIPTSTYEGDPSLSGRDLAQAGRGAVAGVLGFPGDIESLGVAGLSKLGLAKKDEGTFFPTSKDVEDTLFGPAADERDTGYRSLGGLAGGAVTPGGILKAGKGVGAIKGGIDTFRGIPAKGALEGLSKDVTGRVAGAEAAKSQEALQAERRASEARTTQERQAAEARAAQERKAAEERSALDKRAAELRAQQDKLKQVQPAKAEARAETREMEPKPGQPPVALERKDALTRLQGEAAEDRKALGKAQGATQSAASGVVEGDPVEGAAKALDEAMQKPGMSKEDFGERLETAVRETTDKLKKTRAKEADYGPTLDRAGDVDTMGEEALRVDTGGIVGRIKTILDTSVRNATTRRQLEALRKELSNVTGKADGAIVEGEAGEEAVDALTVRQADSLRKNIDDAIASKVYDDKAVSKEALAHLKEVRSLLTKEAVKAWPEYGQALDKFGQYSRPLEFVEKNPLLRKVVADNPAAEEAAVTRAQIVGKLLTEANKQGRKALSKLLTESPGLRDDARMFFTEDLFGPTGLRSAKSVEQMRNWIIKNKPALDQMGLTQEFKDIRTARETAQRAIDKAAGVAKESKRTLAEAEARELAIRKRLTAREKLAGRALDERVKPAIEAREKANLAKRQDVAKGAKVGEERLGKRAADVEKTAQAGSEKAAKTIESEAAKAAQTIEADAKTATKTVAEKQAASKYYNDLGLKLKSAKDPAEIVSTANSAIEKLLKDKHITDDQYLKLRKLVNEAQQKAKDTETMKKRAAQIFRWGLWLAGGYGAVTGGRALTGW